MLAILFLEGCEYDYCCRKFGYFMINSNGQLPVFGTNIKWSFEELLHFSAPWDFCLIINWPPIQRPCILASILLPVHHTFFLLITKVAWLCFMTSQALDVIWALTITHQLGLVWVGLVRNTNGWFGITLSSSAAVKVFSDTCNLAQTHWSSLCPALSLSGHCLSSGVLLLVIAKFVSHDSSELSQSQWPNPTNS